MVEFLYPLRLRVPNDASPADRNIASRPVGRLAYTEQMWCFTVETLCPLPGIAGRLQGNDESQP